jgi:serine/threonine protein kinase
MEYLEGGSLHDILRQSDPSAPIPRARLYWNQLARAVEFLHGNKVIHRDIKPSNVLFKSADRLKLCDFGISKQLGASGETTDTQLGSPHYVAPEVFNGQQYTLSADIWSLGITVLDMYRLSPRKLETWRIAGSDDSAWKRWLSAVLERTQTLPQELSLLGGQLTEDPYQRRSAESLVTGLREEPTDRRSDSSAVAEAGKMAKRLLDPISGNDKRRAKNNTTLP